MGSHDNGHNTSSVAWVEVCICRFDLSWRRNFDPSISCGMVVGTKK